MNLRNRLLTLGALLLAFAARLYTLGDVPFWYDEGLVGWTARRSFADTALWTAADVHPPLYFWAVTVWRLFAGESEFALRLLSVAFGLLSVVAVYKIGERIQGPALGNLAALFLGLSRFHIWWSQELRMYILGSMFMLFSVWLTLRIAHGRPRRADWVAYVLVSLGGLLSIYLVAFALAFESLYMTILLALGWLSRRTGGQRFAAARGLVDWRKYLGWVGAQTCVVLLFLPWFLLFISSYRTWSDSTPFDFTLFVQFYSTMLAAGAAANIDEWLWPVLGVWMVLLAGAALGLLRGAHDGAGRRGGWLIVFLLVLPPLTVYLGTSPRSFFYTPRVEARYLFPFIWSFSLVLAWSVWRIAQARRWLGVAAALAVLGVFVAANGQYYAGRIPNDVYQSLTATLRAQMLPGDGVVLHDDRTWPIFEFYFQKPDRIWRGVPNGARVRDGDAERLLGDFWQAHDAVWMVWNEDALRIDEGHQLEQWLAARAVLTRETIFGTKRLILYVRTPERAQAIDRLAPGATPTYRTSITVDGATLVGYDEALPRYRVGDEVLLGLYWQAARPLTVTVALEDGAGKERGRQSLTVPAGASRALARFPVTTDLTPGGYRIVALTGGGAVPLAQAEIAPTGGAQATNGIPAFTPHEVHFQNGIRLLGYDMPAGLLHPGDNAQLTLYWQTDQPIGQRYKAFVHLLGTQWNPRSNNPLWGQRDQEPANGALPTTSWGVGSIIEDAYLFRVAPDAPPGKYQIEVGLYHPTTGERVPIAAAEGTVDHAILFDVEVR